MSKAFLTETEGDSSRCSVEHFFIKLRFFLCGILLQDNHDKQHSC